ncbi:MAG: CPCC family cysteine-rich protein [Saprospiraceae bacterium]|nr:CPCC family cysteine-rich protein [Saprospiraceae bacterium]
MAEARNEQINCICIDLYSKKTDSSPETGNNGFYEYFLCPCCHFPTLTQRKVFEICLLCNWEDDGQDDHNADQVLGGPNHDYSLTEARNNFKKYLTSYRPSDKYHFALITTEDSNERIQLFKEVVAMEHKLI